MPEPGVPIKRPADARRGAAGHDDLPALAGQDFIVFADNWGRHSSSTQHIFRHLLRQNRVLWVQTIGLRNPSLSAYDVRRSLQILRRFAGRRRGQEAQDPSLWISNPRMLPYSNLAPIRQANRASVVRTVKAAAREIGFANPILVVTAPNAADYLGAFGERLSVYYCTDDFTQWPGAVARQVVVWEEELLRRCDVVMATAESLREKKTRHGRVPLYLSHGVDVEHFAGSEAPIPAAIADLRKPVIGFFGAISPWVDLGLIAAIARSRPEWSVVLIGGADVDVAPLRACPNVTLLGKVPYADLPAFARGFDVGIIPFVVNELTASVNPLKLLEYLACGLPVVSSDMPEVRKYIPLVDVAVGAGAFEAAIARSLSEDSPERRAARQRVAQQSSWPAVAGRFSEYILAALAARPPAQRAGSSSPASDGA